ncbi:MAG: 50S ribosomal protein L11 methyltransferase [Fimbriimonadaceae bacterium]
MTDWLMVRAVFAAAPPDWSVVAEVFDQFGCPGTVQEDRPPAMSAYLADVPGSRQTAQALVAALRELGADEVIVEHVPDETWEELWKQHFAARRIGRRILLRPTWEPAGNEPDLVEIALDPGRAFGTGEHPTTRLCLCLLEEMDLSGKLVLDLGCGSGILAIAAKLLGAKSVDASDIDPTSVEVARENAQSNRVEVSFHCNDGLPNGGGWDIVVSNIISATLIRLAPEVRERLLPGGAWIVSGVLNSNRMDVVNAAERLGFTVEATMEEDDWVAVRFRR